jgi:putative ABC transport system permease protein
MLKSHIRIAVAVLLRRKFFTFVNLFGITFTLAILLVAAAMLDFIFAGAPPEVHQERTLGVLRVGLVDDDNEEYYSTSLPGFDLLDRHLRDLPGAEKVSISSIFWRTLSYVDGQRIESFLKYTDAEFWEILQFEFIEGRPFTRDEVDNASFVVVINRASRERFFAGEEALGRMIEADGKSYRVVGVVENVPLLRFIPFADIWAPLSTADSYRARHEVLGMHQGLILARNRHYFDQIRDEFNARMAAVDLSRHEPFDRIVTIPETTFESAARLAFSQGRDTENQSARLLRWLIVLAVLFMVLPAINMVNLNLSRIMERAPEIGIRKAFGAPASALIGQLIIENLVLTLAGGVLAIAVTYLMLDFIAGTGWIPYAQFHINLRLLGYGLAAALFFGLFSGVYPAWRMSRMHPVDALRGGTS